MKVVQEAMAYVDQTPDEPTKLALLDALRAVTAGKVEDRFEISLTDANNITRI